MMKKQNIILTSVCTIISITCVALTFWGQIKNNGAITTDSYIGIIASLIGVCATIVVGFQIVSFFELRNLKQQIDLVEKQRKELELYKATIANAFGILSVVEKGSLLGYTARVCSIVCDDLQATPGTILLTRYQHLYEDINHMNSISGGLYLDMTLVMFKIYIWGSKGEGFEIFRHVLRGEEIANLKSIEDIKDYIYKGLSELEDGIVNTYNKETKEAFEDFGKGIETRQLPLPNILKYINLENNINDFR